MNKEKLKAMISELKEGLGKKCLSLEDIEVKREEIQLLLALQDYLDVL